MACRGNGRKDGWREGKVRGIRERGTYNTLHPGWKDSVLGLSECLKLPILNMLSRKLGRAFGSLLKLLDLDEKFMPR